MKNCASRKSKSFTVGVKQTCLPFAQEKDAIFILSHQTLRQLVLCSGGRHYSCFPRLFTIQALLKRQPRTKAISASAGKMCQSVRGPWRTTPQRSLTIQALYISLTVTAFKVISILIQRMDFQLIPIVNFLVSLLKSRFFQNEN